MHLFSVRQMGDCELELEGRLVYSLVQRKKLQQNNRNLWRQWAGLYGELNGKQRSAAEQPLTGALYCNSIRSSSSHCARKAAGLRKPSQQKTRKMLTRATAHVHSSRKALCSPLPALPANWLGRPCLASCSLYLGSNS